MSALSEALLPSTVPLLATVLPGWSATRVASLAADLHVNGAVRRTSTGWLVEDTDRTLVVSAASDSFRLSDRRPRWSGLVDPVAAADDWCLRHLPAAGDLVTEAAHEVRPVALGHEITYRYAVRGLPLVGPGSSTTVVVDGAGRIRAVDRRWRRAEPVRDVGTVGWEEVADRFRLRAPGRVPPVRVETVRTALFCAAPDERQATLVPVVEVTGVLDTADGPHRFAEIVPATRADARLSVLPRLLSA